MMNAEIAKTEEKKNMLNYNLKNFLILIWVEDLFQEPSPTIHEEYLGFRYYIGYSKSGYEWHS